MQTEVTFTASDGTTLPGVLTVPTGVTGPGPALVMIYEAFGMTDEMRRVARDLAADGYTVLIPDLFARGPIKPICVARAMRTAQRGEGRELDDLRPHAAGRRRSPTSTATGSAPSGSASAAASRCCSRAPADTR
jgi:carboxymethylenebutenolidase